MPGGLISWLLVLTWVSRLFREQLQWGRRTRGPGRVSCKNIKPECPTLACGQPRQLPGHCCQTCPQGKAYSALRGGRQGQGTGSWATWMGFRTGPSHGQLKPVFLPRPLQSVAVRSGSRAACPSSIRGTRSIAVIATAGSQALRSGPVVTATRVGGWQTAGLWLRLGHQSSV